MISKAKTQFKKRRDIKSLLSNLTSKVTESLLDGVLAQDGSQADALWVLREGLAEALGRAGTVYKYDVSLPLAHFYECAEAMRERLAGTGATVVAYGHVGDGNLHLNVSTPAFDERVYKLIEPHIFEWVAARRGSISAEHGVGVSKPPFMHLNNSPAALALMQGIKHTFDPKGILNPYKVLPHH